MRVSAGELRRIAALARLRLDDDEVEALAAQLTDILGHIDELGEADDAPRPAPDASAAGGAEEAPTGVGLRADQPGVDPLDRNLARLAPGWKDGFFTVPRLHSHRDAGALDEEEP